MIRCSWANIWRETRGRCFILWVAHPQRGPRSLWRDFMPSCCWRFHCLSHPGITWNHPPGESFTLSFTPVLFALSRIIQRSCRNWHPTLRDFAFVLSKIAIFTSSLRLQWGLITCRVLTHWSWQWRMGTIRNYHALLSTSASVSLQKRTWLLCRCWRMSSPLLHFPNLIFS